MQRYEYLQLMPHYAGAIYSLTSVISTDISALKTIRSIVESNTRNPEITTKTDLVGQPCGYTFRKLDNKEEAFFLSVLAWLRDEGWEPFAVHQTRTAGTLVYHFRKLVEAMQQ